MISVTKTHELIITTITLSVSTQQAPEVAGVTFSDTDSAPVWKFLKPDQSQIFFKFKNPIPVQTLTTT